MDWVVNLGLEVPEDWEFEGGAYLLDEQETEGAITANMEQLAPNILENEFSAWTEDKYLWPQSRDLAALNTFFKLHIAVASFDLGKQPLLRADLSNIEAF